MPFYAHTKEAVKTGKTLPKEEWQLLNDHLAAVADLAADRANKFGAGKIGWILGLTHDLGKYSEAFQQRLTGMTKKVDHKTAGAQEVYQKFGNPVGKAMAFVIAGHHGGLPDGNSGDPKNLPERLAKTDIPAYQAFREELSIPDLCQADLAGMPQPKSREMAAFSFSFCIRMLYSCLVDADYLDTERFMKVEKFLHRPQPVPMQELLRRLERKLNAFTNDSRGSLSVINRARSDIQARCLSVAKSSPPGLFSLTVPTGGGKTYASLAFGLKHAAKYNKDRLIYVIPYTSIIEQNAQVFREVLEDGDSDGQAVLEHHSNFDYPEADFDDWDAREKAHRLAAENWDMPVVVTTAVQFFESLYANTGSRCRKLHNLANSVIVLDEAQMMPLEYFKPCLWALAELVLNYGATVVLCTATQPVVNSLLPAGLVPLEIMEDPAELQRIFKRVTVRYGSRLTDETLAGILEKEKQILTIVNTRRHARLLFDRMQTKTQTGIYHLSARMCPVHRKAVLAKIRCALQAAQPCRVVSTQLIEAGVDVDFPIVYRAAAGIDSIAQSAGRCNREGKRPGGGQVTVFEPEPHGMPSVGHFAAVAKLTGSTARRLEELGGDLLSLEAIEDYFQQLLDLERENLDQKGILSTINDGGSSLSFPFLKIAREFQLIDNATVPVIVPFDDKATALMDKAWQHPFPASLARLFQPYVVQVYSYELAALVKAGAVKQAGGIFNFLIDSDYYDPLFGLREAKEVKAPSTVLLW
ncbi:MAG: CRISPR-associated helicase Cas3' [Sporomusaceae bacterium]|nr:CRISPR-associated helicase Cas3' [Sporomusaceae bacterium]